MTEALKATDDESKAHATHPRVSLADIEGAVAAKLEGTGADIHYYGVENLDVDIDTVFDQLETLSICILVMRNGFMVVGKSAPASPENFNAEIGRKLAYEDAVRQVWPLMGYALRDHLVASGRP